jgi:FlaA1/EpsC-like NDP-sugar epimerase
MRAPIRIVDLAQQLINEAQSRPQQGIAVTLTGLRPGDKMSEEFLSQDEFVEQTTEDDKLLPVQTTEELSDRFDIHMSGLERSVDRRDLPSMMEILCEIVPTYRPTELLGPVQKGSLA